MKLRLQFDGKIKEVDWWKDLMDFPRVVELDGNKWEWIMFDADADKHVEYNLMFGKVMNYNRESDLPIPSIDLMFGGYRQNICECGAAYDQSFPNVHLSYCPKRGRI